MTREQFAIGCVILAATGLGCYLIGLWWGGRRSAEDIAALEADLEEALRRHPAGKRRRELSHDETWDLGDLKRTAGLATAAQVPPLEPTSVIPPGESDTAWTRRMGLELEAWTAAKLAETDEWLREMTR